MIHKIMLVGRAEGGLVGEFTPSSLGFTQISLTCAWLGGRDPGAMPVTGAPWLSPVTGGRTVTGIRVWSESGLDCSSQRATQALCFS